VPVYTFNFQDHRFLNQQIQSMLANNATHYKKWETAPVFETANQSIRIPQPKRIRKLIRATPAQLPMNLNRAANNFFGKRISLGRKFKIHSLCLCGKIILPRP
jgi:hypothetical protein